MRRHLWILLVTACSTIEQEQAPPLPPSEPPPVNTQYAQPPQASMEGPSKDDASGPAPQPPPRSPASAPPAPEQQAEKARSSGGLGAMEPADAPRRGESTARRMPQPLREERPGLGTTWGEQRYSAVNEVPFERASSSPTFSGSLYYNDRLGAESMARYGSGYAQQDRATLWLTRGISMSLRDEYGATLPGFKSGSKHYAIGEHGRRYTIVVENRTGTRFEVVLSVDGLDVMDGRPASFGKRGYLIDPYGRIEIEGFRSSSDAVAAFRFGSVRDAYVTQTQGSDRNVGVVGIAAFAERTYVPYDAESARRHQADPFPSKWAPPPPPLQQAH